MRRILSGFGVLVSALAGAGVYMTQVGPDDAVSNLSKWLGKFVSAPDWTKGPAVDEWGRSSFRSNFGHRIIAIAFVSQRGNEATQYKAFLEKASPVGLFPREGF